MLKQAAVALAGFLALTAEGRPQLPAGVSAAACPNYPLCVAEAQDLSIFTPAQQVCQRGFFTLLVAFFAFALLIPSWINCYLIGYLSI